MEMVVGGEVLSVDIVGGSIVHPCVCVSTHVTCVCVCGHVCV